MDQLKMKLLHLSHCRGATPRGILSLLKIDPSLSDLYTLSISSFSSIMQIELSKSRLFYRDLHSIPIHIKWKNYQNYGVSFVSITDSLYPPILKQIYNPPIVLYTLGNPLIMTKPSLAVVGSRKADSYAESAINHLLPPLIQKGFSITSGLARGVDTMAHRAAVHHFGKTTAVLGGGLLHIYPKENIKLAEMLKKEHLILSEYPPDTPVQKWHFPMRNRIISGLSRGTLVIQAERKSGSLITADYALEEGREVFAVPGPLQHPLSLGTNHLIQQGAKLVLSSEDILEELQAE